MSDLMQKLAISKKIMDVHNNIQRGAASPSMPMVENFDTPAASYNIPKNMWVRFKHQNQVMTLQHL